MPPDWQFYLAIIKLLASTLIETLTLIIIMKSIHSTNDLQSQADAHKLHSKLSPRNFDHRKTHTNSPAFKSAQTPSAKKSTKEIKKAQDPLLNRVMPSKSEKILFESSNKLSYKLGK